VPAALAGLTVLAEIAYPLIGGSARSTLTVATVGCFFLASVTHAFATRGAAWTAVFVGVTAGGGLLAEAVGVAAGLLAALIGSGWGAVAGYTGGPLDALMMRIVDAGVAIPTLVLLLLLSAIYTPSPAVLVVVIAASSWLSTAYLVRGAALTLRSREFVQAVRLMGGGRVRAIVRHIAPNALGVITVNVTFQVADAILALATLSYLGLGVRPPGSDWGDMVAGGVRYIYDGYWWEIYPAGLAIIVAVVAFNLLGDGLRDGLAGPGRIH